MKKRRQALTLIEVMISLIISSIIIAVLFSAYVSISDTHKQLEDAKNKLFPREVFHLRFLPIFKQVKMMRTTPQGLIFSYENPLDVDPTYIGTLIGMLYHSEQNELVFITWSKDQVPRKEVFFEKVHRWSVRLFDDKEKKWRLSWETKEGLPSLIHMHIDQMDFAYHL